MNTVLDDERSIEMYLHCRKTLQTRAGKLKVVLPDWSAFPIVKPGSVLLLRPAFKVVVTFPIEEDSVIDDNIGMYRRICFCELYGKGLKDALERSAMRKRKRSLS